MFRYLLLLSFFIFSLSCSSTLPEAPEVEIQLSSSEPIGTLPKITDRPTISHVRIVDLNEDGLQDVLVCDVLGQQVGWIRQKKDGSFIERSVVPGEGVNGPVHVEAVDIDMDGDLDLLVAAMGVILPSDAHLGEIIILENDGEENFTRRIIAQGVQRVTDVQPGDLDGDGDLDLAVAQFGYTQGQVQWFENIGDWNFSPHQLIDRSGAIHAPITDIDNDGDLDILALLSQEWETVYAFVNDGHGNFTTDILHDVADADFSSSGMEVVDLDQDGDADVLWTNGDAFVAVDYRPLPTHGVQWLENHGDLEFEYHRIGQMDGAYGPTADDMDGDGDLDIVTVAEFAFWDNPETRSVVWWEQQENMKFVPHTLATSPTHLVTCDVADIDGNGFPDIVAGGMALYPPFDRITRVTYWRNDGALNNEVVSTSNYPEVIQKALAKATTSGERGILLHANGFSAQKEYKKAIEEDPSNPKWPYYLGMLDVALGDSDSALAHFQHAESLVVEYAPLQARLGELYVGVGELDLAKEKFKSANTEHSLIALAQLLSDKGEWREVIKLLDGVTLPAATSLVITAKSKLDGEEHVPYIAVDMGYQMDDPWLSEVEAECVLAPHLVTQAQTDFIAGKIASAERLLRRAKEIDPLDKDARLALANILLMNGRLTNESIAEAILHLEAGLQVDPNYVMTRTKYGWALYLAKRFDEARAVWISILEDEPNHGPAFANLAQLAYNLKQYQNAYSYYKRAFAVPEDSPFSMSQNSTFQAETLYRYSLAATRIGKQHEALVMLEEAVVLAPSNSSIQFELGNLYIGLKKFTEALPHVEIANALQPDNPRILAALGYAWFQINDTNRAIEFLEQAVNLAPTFALAWYHLGNAQVAQGELRAARESFAMAVQLQPTFTLAKEALLKLEGR